MDFAMMSTITKNAPLMVEIAAKALKFFKSIQIGVWIANAKRVNASQITSVMDFAMMKITIRNAILMEEIAVLWGLKFSCIAQIVCVFQSQSGSRGNKIPHKKIS